MERTISYGRTERLILEYDLRLVDACSQRDKTKRKVRWFQLRAGAYSILYDCSSRSPEVRAAASATYDKQFKQCSNNGEEHSMQHRLLDTLLAGISLVTSVSLPDESRRSRLSYSICTQHALSSVEYLLSMS
eukprot:6173996-Pleurochrysis_carterae.AAC.3